MNAHTARIVEVAAPALVSRQLGLPHHPLNLTKVIPLFSPLLAPVLVAPVLGVRSRDRGSTFGCLRTCAEASVQAALSLPSHRIVAVGNGPV